MSTWTTAPAREFDDEKTSLVVTTISAPNAALKLLAKGSMENNIEFIIVGDAKSPPDFQLGASYFGLAQQRALEFDFAAVCPTAHYSRKNIGYLLALKSGAEIIIETDDDNFPRAGFWGDRSRLQDVPAVVDAGWVNAYRYFTDACIWPRGFPLDEVQQPLAPTSATRRVDCPIQQGLADENPDVDAIFRLVMPLPLSFEKAGTVALGNAAWCPFNSQNTTWFRDAAPLLYLPSSCSFRMTDIWRSFVAQRIAWANDWSVLFHGPTVWQERNDHDLMRDFADEVPGYLRNKEIAARLSALNVAGGQANLGRDLALCYDALIDLGVIDKSERRLLDAWLSDIDRLLAT